MSRKNTSITIGKGEECPKCKNAMQKRKHKETSNLTQAFYFSQWDYCPLCKHVQLYEKYKVANNSKPSVPYQNDLLKLI